MPARPRAASAILILTLLWAAVPAGAQSRRLVLPTTIAAGAATADWVSTYYALTHSRVHEVNPVLRPLEHRPARMVLLGAAIDGATFWLWNRSVGSSRPAIAISGLWAMSAFRGYLAVQNLRNARRAPLRMPDGATAPTPPRDDSHSEETRH